MLSNCSHVYFTRQISVLILCVGSSISASIGLFIWRTCFSDAAQNAARDLPGWRCEIQQWSTGVQMEGDQLMVTIRLHQQPSHHLTIVCCGPSDQRQRLFFLQVRLADQLVQDIYNCLTGGECASPRGGSGTSQMGAKGGTIPSGGAGGHNMQLN